MELGIFSPEKKKNDKKVLNTYLNTEFKTYFDFVATSGGRFSRVS